MAIKIRRYTKDKQTAQKGGIRIRGYNDNFKPDSDGVYRANERVVQYENERAAEEKARREAAEKARTSPFLKLGDGSSPYISDAAEAAYYASGRALSGPPRLGKYLDTARNAAEREISNPGAANAGALETKAKELRQRKYELNNLAAAAMRGGLKEQADRYKGEISAIDTELIQLENDLDMAKAGDTISRLDQLNAQLSAAEKAEARARNAIGQFSGEAGGRMLAQSLAHNKGKYDALSQATKARKAIESEIDRIKYVQDIDKKKYADTFTGQFGANYRAGDIAQDANDAFNRYLTDPTDENKEYAYTLMALEKEFQEKNADVLDDEGAVLPWISQSAAGYLPQLWDNTKATVGGGLAGAAAGALVGQPIAGAKVGATVGTGVQSFKQMRGAVYRDLIMAGVDEETARSAANDEAFISSLIEMGDTAIDMVTLGGGKALNLLGNAAVKSGSKNFAVKGIAKMFGKTAADKAAKVAAKEAGKGVLRKGLDFAGGLALNAAGEAVEEGLQQGVSIANRERDTSGIGDLARKSYGTLKDAFTGKDDAGRKEILDAAGEGAKIALMFGGVQSVTNRVVSNVVNAKSQQQRNTVVDEVLKDRETLDALIQEGKDSGEGTVSAEIADKLDRKLAGGETVTRNDVNRLIASTEVYKEAEAQREAQTARQTAQRTVETRTGYGEKGVETFLGIVESTGMEPDRVRAQFQSAYEAGMTNVPREKLTFVSTVQEAAYNAGRMDNILSMKKPQGATVYGRESGFIHNDASKDLDAATVETFHAMGKALGAKIMMEEQVYGGQSNGSHVDGVIRVAKDAVNPYMVVAKHEVTHRMQALAPEKYNEFRNFAVQMESEWRGETGTTLVEKYQDRAASHDVILTTSQAMDEIAADFTEKILTDEKVLRDFVTEMSQTEDKRTVGQKFFDAVREFIQKVKRVFKGDKARMDAAAQEQFGATVTELERAEQLWKETYKAASENAKKAQKNTAQKGGGVQYSLNAGFANELDAWIKGGKKGGGYFHIGTTSKALQSIGVSDYKIYWNAGKIAKIMKEHPAMTADVIKSVPQVLEHPVLVMQSQTVANRITMFGEAMDADGKPVLVAVELSPQNKRGEVMNFSVIASAYGKNNAQNLIDTSDILYIDADKKRTNTWLEALGLQLPAGLTKYGPIHSITKVDRDVNGNITLDAGDGKTAMQLAMEKAQTGGSVQYSIKEQDGKRYVQADRQVLTGDDPEKWGRQIETFINQQIRKGEDVLFPTEDGHILALTERSAYKLSDRHKSQIAKRARGLLSDDEFALKGRVAGHIDELIQVGVFDAYSEDVDGLHENDIGEDGFNYYTAYFQDGDANKTYYRVTFSSALNENNETVYSIGEIRKRSFTNRRGSSGKTGAQNGGKASQDTYTTGAPKSQEKTAMQIAFEQAQEKSGVKKQFSLKEYSDVEKRDHVKKALDYFGKTYSWKETGYLTPAGAKIDFSGKHDGAPGGYRTVDHRDIRDAIGEDYGGDDYSGAMVQFMGEGNIRISPESNGINLSVKPTKSQEQALSDYISRARGEVILDIDKPGGDTVVSVEYPRGTHANKVLSDIRNYFETGEEPYISPLAQFSYSLKGQSELLKQNEQLKEVVDGLKSQFKTTAFAKVDKKSLDSFTKRLLKDYQSGAEMNDTRAALDALYTYMANGEDGAGPVWDDVYRRAYDTARGILEQSSIINDELYREYKDLRNYLRTTGITLMPEYDHDLMGYESLSDFRKSNFGRIKIVNDGLPVDVAYQELESRFPGLFDSDEHTSQPDQLTHIAEVLDSLQPYEVNPYSHNMREAATWLANDIIERFYELPQAKPTFADKAESRLTNQVIKDAKKLERVREQKNERIRELVAKNREKVKEATQKERAKQERKIQELKEAVRELKKQVKQANVDKEARAALAKTVRQHGDANMKLAMLTLEPKDRQVVREAYDNLIKEYGAIPAGETPAREVQVAKKTAGGKKVSQTVRTVLEAGATPEEAIPTIEQMVTDGDFSYDVYSDQRAIADAKAKIERDGYTGALADWLESMSKGEVSKKSTAMGWALYNNAANAGDMKTAMTVLNKMVQHQRSAAQALQATRILKKLSPDAQLYQAQRSVESLQEELDERYGEKAPKLKVDEELGEKLLKAETQEERDAVLAEIYRDIGRQMPSRFIDKWNAWRYLAMLGNARTHIRNIVGNLGFVPVVGAKNVIATGIEAVVSRVSGGKLQRNKVLFSKGEQGRGLWKAAWADFDRVQDMMAGGKYSDAQNANRHIEEGRVIFRTKPLEKLRRFNSAALEAEDMWFSRPHYTFALVQYCKAHGITAEQLAKGKAILPARAYAVKEAQKATYRDTNAFSQMVSRWGRGAGNKSQAEKAFGYVLEGTLPFRKTPANILVRGVEYSPIGLLKGLSYDLMQVRQGNMSGAEAIDHISAGLTGTGLLIAGVLLAAQGLVRGRGGGDDDENEFEELMGHQAYSLELPGGTSVTLDWLAPESLPFFVGVNLWEQGAETDGGATLSDFLSAIGNVTEPMLEMSCLQSLNDLFESVGYASSNDLDALSTILSSAATSYLTQALPTIFGQIERTSEKHRMTTYTQKNAFLTPDMQYTLGKASARLPGLDFNQIPYIDAWGRKEITGSTLTRLANNFLNPAFVSERKESAMEKELLRLYNATGEGAVLPSRAARYFTVDGERKDLTAQEYVRYATLKGQNAYTLVTKLTGSREYKALPDEKKAEAVQDAYKLADQKAKAAVSRYSPESWVARAMGGAEYGVGELDYIKYRMALDQADKPNENGQYGTYTAGEKTEAVLSMSGLGDEAMAYLLDTKEAYGACEAGVDMSAFAEFTAQAGDIEADKDKRGETISGSRKRKIEELLDSMGLTEETYLYLMGTQYDSVKKSRRYISYFGREE